VVPGWFQVPELLLERQLGTRLWNIPLKLPQDPRTGEWKRGNDEFSTAVDEESALLQFPDTMEVKIPVDADHSNMVKFDSKNNQTYSSAVGHLKDVISNTRGTVNGRFCM
jgi:hypothetical protein